MARTAVSGAGTTYSRQVDEEWVEDLPTALFENQAHAKGELEGPPRPVARKRSERVVATSTGASATATGDNNKADIDTTPPTQAIGADGSANATGGGGRASVSASMAGSGKVWLILAGVGGLAVGGWFLYRRNIRAALVAAGVGASLLALAFLPAWVLALGGVALAAAWLLSEQAGSRNREALGAVVAGVAAAPSFASAQVKTEIAKQATARDRDVIRRVKREDELNEIEAAGGTSSSRVGPTTTAVTVPLVQNTV